MANSPSDNQPLRFGIFELEIHAGELRKSGRLVRLRPQAVRVLVILASSPGQLITREQFREQIWDDHTFVDFEHGLNLCIREIRAALSDDAESPRYIETLPKRGYRFVAVVTRDSFDLKLGNAVSAGPESADAIRSRSRAVPLRAVALVAIIGGLVGVLTFADPGQWRERLLARFAPPIRSVAVLPLRNLSGDPAQDYFADGVTEALTTDLARMETLQVISLTSAMQYKAVKKTLPAIARELKADAIVEGSVERSGNQVRITAQLIRADTDKHLWAETYERDSRDILALQGEVASAIAQQIEARLGGPKPSTPPKIVTVNPDAYETYLQANYYFDNQQLPKSIDYYNQAVKLDPNYAPTYAHMARAYFFLAFFGALSPQEGWNDVKQTAMLAIEKDETIPEAHGALALAKMHYDWDFAGAEREFKRGLELNPNDADIHHDYAHYLMAMGRVAESAAESKRAVELDPIGTTLTSCLCWHSFAARQYDDAVRLATQFLASEPDNPWEHTILGWTYEQKRMPDQAIAEFQKAVGATQGRAFYVAALGHAYAMAGRRSDAEQVLQTLSQRANKSYVSAFDVAAIYAGLGDKDTAFAWLDKAAGERSTFLAYSKWEPRLDPLRSDPRFKQLLTRIGLPQ